MAETNIRYLPEGLRVDGDLIAVDSSLVELPENLYVGGNLDVMGSKVKSLSNNMTVRGQFHSKHWSVQTGLSIGGK